MCRPNCGSMVCCGCTINRTRGCRDLCTSQRDRCCWRWRLQAGDCHCFACLIHLPLRMPHDWQVPETDLRKTVSRYGVCHSGREGLLYHPSRWHLQARIDALSRYIYFTTYCQTSRQYQTSASKQAGGYSVHYLCRLLCQPGACEGMPVGHAVHLETLFPQACL